MILSDRTLKTRTDLTDSISDGAIQPASLDLHLGPRLRRLGYGVTIDPERDQSALWTDVPLRDDGRWCLGQNELYLAVTSETITLSDIDVGLLHGLSSLGRLGLLVHCTAGVVDPKWRGRLTLELVSLGGSILLRPSQRIAQLTVHRLSTPCDAGYSGKYSGDTDPTPSRMFQETPA